MVYLWNFNMSITPTAATPTPYNSGRWFMHALKKSARAKKKSKEEEKEREEDQEWTRARKRSDRQENVRHQ
jgi:hypothetical protein